MTDHARWAPGLPLPKFGPVSNQPFDLSRCSPLNVFHRRYPSVRKDTISAPILQVRTQQSLIKVREPFAVNVGVWSSYHCHNIVFFFLLLREDDQKTKCQSHCNAKIAFLCVKLNSCAGAVALGHRGNCSLFLIYRQTWLSSFRMELSQPFFWPWCQSIDGQFALSRNLSFLHHPRTHGCLIQFHLASRWRKSECWADYSLTHFLNRIARVVHSK